MAYKVIIINLPKIINFRSVSLSSVAEGVAEGVAMPLPVSQIILYKFINSKFQSFIRSATLNVHFRSVSLRFTSGPFV